MFELKKVAQIDRNNENNESWHNTSLSFPIGMAATNRIIAYSKGLIADNASITVFCLNPYYRKEELSLEKIGVYEGINYHFFTNPYRAKMIFFINYN